MSNHPNQQVVGGLLAALSALGFATNPIFGKMAYAGGANVISLGFIRFGFASLLLSLYLALKGESDGLTWQQRVKLVGLGVFGIAVVSLLYFSALSYSSASLATGLFYTYPAMVAIASLVRGGGITRWGVAGLLLTAAGTWVTLGTDMGAITWQGIVLILSSAAVYTGYILVSEHWAWGIPPMVTTAHVTAGTFAVYLVLVVATRPATPNAQAYLAGGGLSLTSTILALTTFYGGLFRIGPTRAAIIANLEPVFTALMAFLLLGEGLTALQTAGIGMVVAGAVAAQIKGSRDPSVEQG